MIVGAAFVPATPLLVPVVGQGAAAELDDLLAAARTALRRSAASADRVMLVASGSFAAYPDGSAGTLAGYGVPLEVTLGQRRDDTAGLVLPPPLSVGAWLVEDVLGPAQPASGVTLAQGDDLPPTDERVALVVVGDGSARRSLGAPGYLDERAESFDAGIAEAFAVGPDALGAAVADPELATELLVDGAPVWSAAARALGGRHWRCDRLYAAAPYGVGYFVAAWTA